MIQSRDGYVCSRVTCSLLCLCHGLQGPTRRTIEADQHQRDLFEDRLELPVNPSDRVPRQANLTGLACELIALRISKEPGFNWDKERSIVLC